MFTYLTQEILAIGSLKARKYCIVTPNKSGSFLKKTGFPAPPSGTEAAHVAPVKPSLQRWAQAPVLAARGAFALGGLLFSWAKAKGGKSSENELEGEGGPLDRHLESAPIWKNR